MAGVFSRPLSLQSETLQKRNVAFINIIHDSPDQPMMHCCNMKFCIADWKLVTMLA